MTEDYPDLKPDAVKLESELILDGDVETDTDFTASYSEACHDIPNVTFVESNPVSPERICPNLTYGRPPKPEPSSNMSQDDINVTLRIKEEITEDGIASPDLPPNNRCLVSSQTIDSAFLETSSCFSAERTSVKAEDGLTESNIIHEEASFKCCVGEVSDKIAISLPFEQCSNFSEHFLDSENDRVIHPQSAVVCSNNSTQRQNYSGVASNEKEVSTKHCKAQFKSSAAVQEETSSQSNWLPLNITDSSVIIKQKLVNESDNLVDEDNETDMRQMQTSPSISYSAKCSAPSNKKNFSFTQCAAQFQSKYTLETHLLKQLGKRVFSCDQCSLEFKYKSHFQRHLLNHGVERAFSCDQCSARFKQKQGLYLHSLTHSNVKAFTCDVCSAQFKRKCILKLHLSIHSNERAFTCDHCPAQFKRKTYLQRHLLIHANERMFSCDECSAQFKCKAHLRRHVLTHSDKQASPSVIHPYASSLFSNSSTQCTRQSYSEVARNEREVSTKDCKAHLKSSAAVQEETSQSNWLPLNFADRIKEEVASDSDNCVDEDNRSDAGQIQSFPSTSSSTKCSSTSNERNLSGTQCAAQFERKHTLQTHLLIDPAKRVLFCDQCSARFTQKRYLTRHLSIHSKKEPFTAAKCRAQFKSEGKFKQHVLIHPNKKPFSCELCSFQFKKNYSLQAHMLTHSNVKAFTCDECSAQFKRKGDLKHHSLVHSKKREFACNQCSARFEQKGGLSIHLLTHSNRKEFACDQCPAQFKQKSDLTRHFLIHTIEKSFTCDHCPAQFKQKGILKRHMLTHSNKKEGV